MEETREQLCSSLKAIRRAPYAEVVAFKESKPYGAKLYDVTVDYWRNRFNSRGKEPYKIMPGDILILTDAKPETVSDLRRLRTSWTFVSVTRVPEDEDEYENQNDIISTYFKIGAAKDLQVNDGTKRSFFFIFLMNIIPNKRIWNSLHMSGNLKVIKEVLCIDSLVSVRA